MDLNLCCIKGALLFVLVSGYVKLFYRIVSYRIVS